MTEENEEIKKLIKDLQKDVQSRGWQNPEDVKIMLSELKKIEKDTTEVPEPDKTPDIDELKKQIRKEVEQENKEKQDKEEKERLLEDVFHGEEDKEELSLKELQLLSKDRNKDTGGVPFIETKTPEKSKKKKLGKFEYDTYGVRIDND